MHNDKIKSLIMHNDEINSFTKANDKTKLSAREWESISTYKDKAKLTFMKDNDYNKFEQTPQP